MVYYSVYFLVSSQRKVGKKGTKFVYKFYKNFHVKIGKPIKCNIKPLSFPIYYHVGGRWFFSRLPFFFGVINLNL